MRSPGVVILAIAIATAASAGESLAQGERRFPPDSATNLKVFPVGTPVNEVISTMRQFSIALGVNCTHCHAGNEDTPFDSIDFAADEKRNKLVAREMMQMLADANRRIDSLPGRDANGVSVGCATCHRGITIPLPLDEVIARTTLATSVDSAAAMYRALRQRYYGRAAYDFNVQTLNSAAGRLAQVGRLADAFAIIRLNDEFHPTLAAVPNAMAELYLAQADTTSAAEWYRSALSRDSEDRLALTRLRQIGRL